MRVEIDKKVTERYAYIWRERQREKIEKVGKGRNKERQIQRKTDRKCKQRDK